MSQDGMSLADALDRLRVEQESKVDVVLTEGQDMVAVATVEADAGEDGEAAVVPRIEFADSVPGLGGQSLAVQRHAHGQIAAKLQIPRKYYDRMIVEAPDLVGHERQPLVR